MSYFTPSFFKYLKDLKTHNTRPWFESNRARYEAEVKEPMLRFITDLGPGIWGDGLILARWIGLRVVHAEGVWIDPRYRKSPGIVRRLVNGMGQIARHWGVKSVWTGADTDDVRRLIEKLGGTRIPMDPYVLPLLKKESG